ncbi:unnamed protein product [Spirodela intermedia]|uniref:Uncharacterized protein n=1 Tax=Spirodela intermedia TaxID=51605 RepID=A0A7I8K7A8_SPIIN|nr:unnamed protein product [Spirodela intermedia]
MESPVSHAGGEEPEARTPVVSSGTNLVAGSQSSSRSRLWRPAAQRNLRNQWSRLVSCRGRWVSASSEGRASATALVNAYLSRRYMPEMNLGVLKDMPMIRENACEKLERKQELCQRKLLSSYKDLVDAVSQFTKARDSMRCYLKGSSASPLVQFSQLSQDNDDPGDGGGVPVFTSWALPYFEKLAQELIDMFAVEISLKRLIVLQLLSIACQDAQGAQADERNWSIELYEGEFNDLNTVDLLCRERFQPNPPRIRGFQSNNPATEQINRNPTRETLHVYLTAWISDVNVDIMRVDEIFGMVEDEMQLKLS